MNHPRRSGKRRRSTLGSDSWGSGDDSSDSPLLPLGRVLSPPPGLGRSLMDRGRPPAAAAGTLRLSVGNGRDGPFSRTMWREVFSPREACLFAQPTQLLVSFSVCDSTSVRQVAFCLDTDVLSVYIQRLPCSNTQVVSGSFDLYRNNFPSWLKLITGTGLTPNSAQYSLQILHWMCFMSRVVHIDSLLPTHRNSKIQWRAEGMLNSTINCFFFFSERGMQANSSWRPNRQAAIGKLGTSYSGFGEISQFWCKKDV